MNRLPHILVLLAALVLTSCQSASMKISGRFAGTELQKVYLEQVTPLGRTLIDSAKVDKAGNYSLEIGQGPQTPSLYNLVCNTERIPLLLQHGDRVTVSAVGNIIRNYTVENSPESELLRGFYRTFITGAQNLRKIAAQYGEENLDAERQKALGKEYAAEYYRIRREQLRFIIANKNSLAAVYALSQRLPGDRFLVNGDNDVIYYREVADALQEKYPESPYLQSLRGEIARMDARQDLQTRISEAGFPDLELSTIFGEPIRLSSLKGKVILLDFWSAELGSSNVLNNELREIYRKYRNAPTPFEVYQVAIDTNKALWISAVQDQQLPWISVSDLQGARSSALGIYNVKSLPANFLIDKDGEVVGKNLYGKSLEERLDTLTR